MTREEDGGRIGHRGTRAREKIVGARRLVRNHGPVLALPQDRSLGVVERNSFRFFPADRLARSNGTNGTAKTESIPFYEEVTSEALASWCATMSKLRRLRPPKMDACHPSWRTNWRAPTKNH